MKNKILIISTILVVIMSVFIGSVFALENLNISITTSNANAKVDDVIDIYVNWKEKMQAADYILNYDSDKLEFISANISEDNYSVKTLGKINVCWYSGSDELTGMTFKFKVIGEGDANLNVEVEAFANENLERPSDYNSTPLVIKNIVKKEDLTPTPTPTATPTATPAPTVTPSQSPKPTEIPTINPIEDNGEDSTVSETEIPYAGKEFTIFFAMIAIGIVSIVLSFKLKDLRDVK